MFQGGESGTKAEIYMPRSGPSRGLAKNPMSQVPSFPGMPFKEQHLKQLRAQCLVFLAFRNGLMPKKLHLEIALGGSHPKEGGNSDGARSEVSDHRGKEISIKEPSCSNEVVGAFGRPNDMRETERNPPYTLSTGNMVEIDSSSKGIDNAKMIKNKKGPSYEWSVIGEERKQNFSGRMKPDSEMQARESVESQVVQTTTKESGALLNSGNVSADSKYEKNDLDNSHKQVGRTSHVSSSVIGMNTQLKPDVTSWTGIGIHHEALKGMVTGSMVQHEPFLDRKDNIVRQPQNIGSYDARTDANADCFPIAASLKEQTKHFLVNEVEHQTVPQARDANMLPRHVPEGESHISKLESNNASAVLVAEKCSADGSEIQKQCSSNGFKMVPLDDATKNGNSFAILEKSMQQEEENRSVSTDLPPSRMYTTSEKWIMDQQKRKLLGEQNWALKQRKTEQRIAMCVNKLKETVSSSEDISAKTKSVIELKKLQLLQLQRRVRKDFLNDFFKPIASDMERLKSTKKHRHGRRIKQLEKFEQKMKEERQKRIRERQKEFFSEIEVHKERLDDGFKIKRERWKGFNKYVKEFHKRKERIHREKIDRIQREKINLLKNNDVEGYLRMVQDAKSDRVKQLLKETEKYLQKLGAKLQDAKTISRHFENEMDENRGSSVVEKNEIVLENEDESDQAEHYLESNEKYYLMAHSIKETIAEQPTSIRGGKLREYQMNGLRWLVSLYNNHLNGILADEMGLGKTVQVIALICYLMEAKNDRGPFLVVVPSSVLSGWETEISLWAPDINKIAYAGPPEERRRLFKERIVHQKFNVLLTTYEYLMNKHDRPKLSKIQWHYIIIDEGHRIKNASCKLNADLKHYQSSHKLLLTGTPLQNNLEELWALLNFLLPNIFNSSEDFSQWFNKPFESNGDNSLDEALLSEEENLLIINRLHQVLRPFVLRRLKHKVENQLPEKIERLVRCEASAYQKLLMKRVDDNLGSLGSSKGRSVHNSVMELRNICNHPYISQLHTEEVNNFIPKHYLPPIVRLCGKLEMLDRLLPKLKATDHRVLFFSTMTRLLDVMEEYLHGKRYRYLRLDGHTSGNERGALIDEFNRPDSPHFIFLLSIRAGGVGVNLQAADTVIIFDTDWNPQVDLQAQARAHRIGQKRDVLVLRLETVRTVEEQVRAAAEHKLGVANQSITAGFFDNNTSAEDRREYLESLLRECKKEESASVLDDDALNDLLARSESEIDVFESVDKQRREEEMVAWQKLVQEQDNDGSELLHPSPSRLVTDDDLKEFYKAMHVFEVANVEIKRKRESLGGLDTQHYGRGKRAREVRSYEDQWTEEEFEKMCQADSPESPKLKEGEKGTSTTADASGSKVSVQDAEEPPPQPPAPAPAPPSPPHASELLLPPPSKELPSSRRGRGRPKRATPDISPSAMVPPSPSETVRHLVKGETVPSSSTAPDTFLGSVTVKGVSNTIQNEFSIGTVPGSLTTTTSLPVQVKGPNRKTPGGVEAPRRRGKKQNSRPADISPESNPISKIAMGRGMTPDISLSSSAQDNQKAASRSSGTLNAPIVTGSEINLVSRVSKDAAITSAGSSGSAFSTDRHKVIGRPSGTSNAPTIVTFEVNPISGLRKMVELVPVRAPIRSFTPEKYKSTLPGVDKKDPEKGVIVSETKVPPPQNTSMAGMKVASLPVGKEHKDDLSSTHVMPALAQDLQERRSLRMGSMDVMVDKEQRVAENLVSSSVPSIEIAGNAFDSSKEALPASSTDNGAGQLDLPVAKPVESITCQNNLFLGTAPLVNSPNINNEKPSVPHRVRQTKSSADKDKSKRPAPVKRGPKKKDFGLPNDKQAISSIKSSKAVVTATTTSHACSARSMVAKKDNHSLKDMVTSDKEETDAKKLRDTISDGACQYRPDLSSDQGPTSTEKSATQSEEQSSKSELFKSDEGRLLRPGDEELPFNVELSQRPDDPVFSIEQTQGADFQNVSSMTKSSVSDEKVGESLDFNATIEIDKQVTDTQELNCAAQVKMTSSPSVLHETAARSMDKNSANLEAIEVNSPVRLTDEGLPSEAETSQIPGQCALSLGQSQAGGVNEATLLKDSSSGTCVSETESGLCTGTMDSGALTANHSTVDLIPEVAVNPDHAMDKSSANPKANDVYATVRLKEGLPSESEPPVIPVQPASSSGRSQAYGMNDATFLLKDTSVGTCLSEIESVGHMGSIKMGIETTHPSTVDLIPVVVNATLAMGMNPACPEINEVDAPLRPNNEGLASEAEPSVIPVQPASSLGRYQPHGMNDATSLLKESSTGTCSSGIESGSSMGSIYRSGLATHPSTVDPFLEVVPNPSLGEPQIALISNCSESVMDSRQLGEMKSTTGANSGFVSCDGASSMLINTSGESKCAQESTLTEKIVPVSPCQKDDVLSEKPLASGTNANGCSMNTSTIQINTFEESEIPEGLMMTESNVPVSSGQKVGAPCEKLLPSDMDLSVSCISVSSIQINRSLESKIVESVVTGSNNPVSSCAKDDAPCEEPVASDRDLSSSCRSASSILINTSLESKNAEESMVTETNITASTCLKDEVPCEKPLASGRDLSSSCMSSSIVWIDTCLESKNEEESMVSGNSVPVTSCEKVDVLCEKPVASDMDASVSCMVAPGILINTLPSFKNSEESLVNESNIPSSICPKDDVSFEKPLGPGGHLTGSCTSASIIGVNKSPESKNAEESMVSESSVSCLTASDILINVSPGSGNAEESIVTESSVPVSSFQKVDVACEKSFASDMDLSIAGSGNAEESIVTESSVPVSSFQKVDVADEKSFASDMDLSIAGSRNAEESIVTDSSVPVSSFQKFDVAGEKSFASDMDLSIAGSTNAEESIVTESSVPVSSFQKVDVAREKSFASDMDLSIAGSRNAEESVVTESSVPVSSFQKVDVAREKSFAPDMDLSISCSDMDLSTSCTHASNIPINSALHSKNEEKSVVTENSFPVSSCQKIDVPHGEPLASDMEPSVSRMIDSSIAINTPPDFKNAGESLEVADKSNDKQDEEEASVSTGGTSEPNFEVAKCESKNPKNWAANELVQAGCDLEFSVVSEHPLKHDDTTLVYQNEVVDVSTAAPVVSLTGRLCQPDAVVTKHDDSSVLLPSEVLDQAVAPNVSASSRMLQSDEQVVENFATHFEADISGVLANPENGCEPAEQTLELPSMHLTGSDCAIDSVSLDKPGKADDCMECHTTIELAENAVPAPLDNASILSETTLISSLGEQISSLPIIDNTVPDSVQSLNSRNPVNACCSAMPGQSEDQDLLETNSIVTDKSNSLTNLKKADEFAELQKPVGSNHVGDPDHLVIDGLCVVSSDGDKLDMHALKASDVRSELVQEDSTIYEKAADGGNPGSVVLLDCASHPISGGSHEVPFDNFDSPVAVEHSDDGRKNPSTAAHEPASGCSSDILLGDLSDKDRSDRNIEDADNFKNESNGQEDLVSPAEANCSKNISVIEPIVATSGEDTNSDSPNLVAYDVGSEDKEAPVSEIVCSTDPNSFSTEPVSEDHTEEQFPPVFDGNKGHSEANYSIGVNISQVQSFSQPALDILSEDHTTAGVPDVLNSVTDNPIDVSQIGCVEERGALKGNMDSSSSPLPGEQGKKDNDTLGTDPSGSSVPSVEPEEPQAE